MFLSYDLNYVQQLLKTLCFDQKWIYKEIEAGDILVKYLF